MDEKNVLIAFDGSASALRAVDYVGSQFSGLKDMKVTLLYVVPNVPPQFWDDGHILTPSERQERQEVIGRWLANQKTVMEPHFEKARRMLTEKGFNQDQVDMRVISDVTTVAEAVVEEAKTGGYRTLVLGRRGAVPILTGGLAASILHKGAGLAVCIVE